MGKSAAPPPSAACSTSSPRATARLQQAEASGFFVSTDIHGRNQRLVLKFASLQALAGVPVALGFAALGPPHGGWVGVQAALAGALVMAGGTLVFGWKMFRPGVAPARQLATAWYAGEVLKWAWVGLAMWLALDVAGLAPLPLLSGVLAGQVGFWLGVAWFK